MYFFALIVDLFVSKHNRLTVLTTVSPKIFWAWLKFGKHDTKKKLKVADAKECIK